MGVFQRGGKRSSGPNSRIPGVDGVAVQLGDEHYKIIATPVDSYRFTDFDLKE